MPQHSISTECVVSFEFPSYTYEELDSNSNQFVVLQLLTPTEVTIGVQVNIAAFSSDGTATEATLNQDYNFNNGLTATFTEQGGQNILLSVLADDFVERREGFTLQFARLPGSPPISNGPNPTTTVFIDDSDGNCQLTKFAQHVRIMHIDYPL